MLKCYHKEVLAVLKSSCKEVLAFRKSYCKEVIVVLTSNRKEVLASCRIKVEAICKKPKEVDSLQMQKVLAHAEMKKFRCPTEKWTHVISEESPADVGSSGSPPGDITDHTISGGRIPVG